MWFAWNLSFLYVLQEVFRSMNNFSRINISKTAHCIFFTIFLAYTFVIFNYIFVEASPAANEQSISNIQNMMLGKSNINARLSNGLDQPISDWFNKDVPFFYPVLLYGKTIANKPPKPDTNEVHIGGLDSRNYYTKKEVNYID